MKICKTIINFAFTIVISIALFLSSSFADSLPTHNQLRDALKAVVEEGSNGNGTSW